MSVTHPFFSAESLCLFPFNKHISLKSRDKNKKSNKLLSSLLCTLSRHFPLFSSRPKKKKKYGNTRPRGPFSFHPGAKHTTSFHKTSPSSGAGRRSLPLPPLPHSPFQLLRKLKNKNEALNFSSCVVYVLYYILIMSFPTPLSASLPAFSLSPTPSAYRVRMENASTRTSSGVFHSRITSSSMSSNNT